MLIQIFIDYEKQEIKHTESYHDRIARKYTAEQFEGLLKRVKVIKVNP